MNKIFLCLLIVLAAGCATRPFHFTDDAFFNHGKNRGL